MRHRTILTLLFVAIAARAVLLGWDSGLLSPHPDERQVAFVTERVTSWGADPGFSAYGSLHFFAIRGATRLLGLADGYEQFLHAGRALSLTASLLALLLALWVARRAWGERTAAVLMVLVALVPLDLQQSHFATVEAHHALWVMAALAAAWWLAWRGGTWSAAVAGAAVGASLAVKVSSLPLVVPLGVALILLGCRTGARKALAGAAAGAAGVLAVFVLGQPSAFPALVPPAVGVLCLAVAAIGLRAAPEGSGPGATAALVGALLLAGMGVVVVAWTGLKPEYLKGVLDQIAMATGHADLPYVRVYRHTLPVFYPLRELALWGLGPGLLAAALAGGSAAAVRSGRRLRRWLEGRIDPGSALLAVLLAWVVPMGLRLATLQVKYLRYWEPLVLPLALLAAWWLGRLPRTIRRRAVAAVAAITLLCGAAYLTAFVEPHPHRQAVEWLAGRLEPGSRVAFEHWDEGLPLSDIHRLTLTSYDLPDDRAKARRLCDTLASADWVVLTSNRVRRTVLANPELFPRTARLYRLLLTGRTGFEPVTRFDRSPRLLGLRLPVELADESFVNYEMPRVVVLRRLQSVDPAALAARLERPLPRLEGTGPGGLERLMTRDVTSARPAPGSARQVADLVGFVIVLLWAGGAAWLLLLPWLEVLPDAGIGLALVTGWVGLGWVPWLGAEAGLPAPSPAFLLGLLVLASTAGVWSAQKRCLSPLEILRRRRRGAGRTIAVMSGVFLLLLLVRLVSPAIWWGEKPMDLTFLNAFLNAGHWPPGEPWMAGMPLHYYYFGEILAATPLKAAGIGAAVGYNLVVAALPALAAGVLVGLGLALARRRSWTAALAAPILLLLSGNLAWPFLGDLIRSHRLFDAWWATSRVIPGFAIDEYPLWTSLFADLHAHFLALPVLLATLSWGWLVVRPGRRQPLTPAVMTGILAGVLAATNPWDILVMTAALAAGLVVTRKSGKALLLLMFAGTVAVAAVGPFLAELGAWLRAGAGGLGVALNTADHAPAWAVMWHFGQFLLPLAVGAVVVLRSRVLPALALAAGAAGVGLTVGSGALAVALGCGVLFAAAAWASRGPRARLAFLLAAVGAAVVSTCEVVTIMDRMNTLFKLYNGAWILLGGGLALLLIGGSGWGRRAALWTWAPLGVVAAGALVLGVAQAALEPRISSPRPTLDGEAFLAVHDPSTAWLVETLRAVARPGDVVAEAAGPSYRNFTRIAMHTGLPTVVGWDWHLQQRGQAPGEIEARRHDLEVLYGGDDAVGRRAVLDRYGIRWIVVGELERRTYGIESEAPFADVPGVQTLCAHGTDRLDLVLPDEPDEGPAGKLPGPAVATASAENGTLALLPGGGLLVIDPDGTPRRAVPAPTGATGVAWMNGRPAVITPAGPLVLGEDGVWSAPAGAGDPAEPR